MTEVIHREGFQNRRWGSATEELREKLIVLKN